MVFTKSFAFLWHPIQFPLTKTLHRFFYCNISGSKELKSSTPKSSKISINVLLGEPTETKAINDKFLTKPQA